MRIYYGVFMNIIQKTNGIMGAIGENTNQSGMVFCGQKGSFYSHIWRQWQGELWENCIVK